MLLNTMFVCCYSIMLTNLQGNELGDDPNGDLSPSLSGSFFYSSIFCLFRGEIGYFFNLTYRIYVNRRPAFYKNVIGSSGIIFEICGVLIKFISKNGLLGQKSAFCLNLPKVVF